MPLPLPAPLRRFAARFSGPPDPGATGDVRVGVGPALRARLQTMGIAIAIALVATFPMVLSPFSRLIGHGDVDVGNHAWGPWWWWSTLGRGTLPWETKLLGAPAGGVLWFIDPVLAGLGAAVVGIVGVVGAYNLVILLYVALAALATRSLARAFGAGEAAWVAAVTAAMGPYLLSEVHNGVSEAVGVAWGTFALAAARRGLAGGGARAWVACGAWLGLATAGTWYYGFAAGITIGCWALLELLGPDRRAALRNVAGALGAGALAGVLAAPVLALVRASVSDPASLVLRSDVGPAVREVLLAHNAVDPRAFFAPFGFQSVDLAAQGEAFLHSSYVGLVALALAGWALRRGRVSWRVAIGVLPAAVLSLGAWLSWGGEWVTIGGGRLALPFGWLVSALPDAGATHSQRLAWPVIATVAALAAVGAGELIREHGRRVLIWITAACALDMALSAPWPLARMDALDTRAHEALGELARAERAAARAEGRPVRVGVLDLPAEVGRTMATSRYLVYQAASGLPIPYRPDARGGTATLFGRPWFNVLFAMSAARPDEVESLRRALDGVTRVDLNLDSTELRWIVLHRELERGAGDVLRLEQQLRAWFGEPEVSGEHLTWDVRARGAGAGQGEVLR